MPKKPAGKQKAADKGVGVAKHPGGRPSSYSPELSENICTRLSQGESLVKICSGETYPDPATVYRWLEGNTEFRERYARARSQQADFLAAQIVEIADDGKNDTYKDDEGNVCTNHDVINRSRLRVDARKWYASKLAPKKYGDKLELEVEDKRENNIDRLVELLGRATGRDSKSPNTK